MCVFWWKEGGGIPIRVPGWDWVYLGVILIYLFGSFTPEFLTEFKTSLLGFIFSCLWYRKKKKRKKRVIFLCVLPRAMGMAMKFLGFREEERRKQNILWIRGESNTEKGLAGER